MLRENILLIPKVQGPSQSLCHRHGGFCGLRTQHTHSAALSLSWSLGMEKLWQTRAQPQPCPQPHGKAYVAITQYLHASHEFSRGFDVFPQVLRPSWGKTPWRLLWAACAASPCPRSARSFCLATSRSVEATGHSGCRGASCNEFGANLGTWKDPRLSSC